MKRHRSEKGRVGPGLFAPLFLALSAAAAFYFWQDIHDYATYLRYSPSTQIEELADRSYLHDKGKYYFYVSQPVLEGTQIFNQYCSRSEEKSAILGCYDGSRIYVFSVTDERLSGIEEVTAAHETLHAAWDRLSEAEKAELEPLLEETYQANKTNELEERMEYYDRTEPGQHYNELHSILPTEFKDLPDELDQYYSRYFSDREAIVALHVSYQNQFIERQARISELHTQLSQMADRINQATEQYNAASSRLNNDIQDFNRRAQAGAYQTESAFYRDRQILVERADALDVERQRIEQIIADFERMRNEYEQLTDEAEDLQRSIDSSLAPAPAV